MCEPHGSRTRQYIVWIYPECYLRDGERDVSDDAIDADSAVPFINNCSISPSADGAGFLIGGLFVRNRTWRRRFGLLSGAAGRGQAMVEFAIIGTVFFVVLAAIVNGSWLVFASVTASNAARNGARWAIAQDNYVAAPAFGQCSNTDSGLLSAVAADSGPFAGAVAAGQGVAATPVSLSGDLGCRVTVTFPTGGLMGIFDIGPQSVSGSSTAYVVS